MELSIHLEDAPLITRGRILLQRDGETQHFGREVTEFFIKISLER
jgi:hypothetical protein